MSLLMLDIPYTLNLRGNLFVFDEPKVMGILNVTPDSFFDGGKYNNSDLARVEERVAVMLKQGAAMIDIGGASSRPGAAQPSLNEELERVIPVLEYLAPKLPEAIFSVDTYRSEVAKQAITAGAHIVNDISAGSLDENMYATVAELGVPYIAMHMQGTPETMQQAPTYDDAVQEVYAYLYNVSIKLRDAGVKDVIIDPGFGFGKTVSHNFALLDQLNAFQFINRPVLVGISRKSMICKPLKVNPKDALNGTTALHMIALERGANILRVHDVREAVQTIKLFKELNATRLTTPPNS